MHSSEIHVTCCTPRPEVSFAIVQRRILKCLANRFSVTDNPCRACLQIHVGTPDSLPLRSELPDGLLLVAYSFAEATHIPTKWVQALNACHEVWVPSQFVKRAFVDSGVSRLIRVIPLGIECEVNAKPLPAPDAREPFTFLWQGMRQRRFVDGQINDGDKKRGFLVEQAFRTANLPRARLILKSLPVDGYSHSFLVDPVWSICKTLSPAEMDELDRHTDVFVWPTTGEGFGLPPLEKLAKGIPAFCTYWSGTAEYLRDFPIPRLSPSSIRTCRFNGIPAQLAFVDMDRLVELMRYAYAHRGDWAKLRPLLHRIACERWDYRRCMQPPLLDAVQRTVAGLGCSARLHGKASRP